MLGDPCLIKLGAKETKVYPTSRATEHALASVYKRWIDCVTKCKSIYSNIKYLV